MRSTALLLVALAGLVWPAGAEERLAGLVSVQPDGVRVGEAPVRGPLAEALRGLDGRAAEVELAADGRTLTRVLHPERTEVRGTLGDDGALLLADGARLGLFGPAAGLVPADRAAVMDVWLLEGEACVVAVEARTTDDWNLVHLHSGWPSPVGVIRSRRPVWVFAARDGRFLLQHGATRGWVDAAQVSLGEGPAAGLIDRLPR